jgi:hypothetical protein
LKRQYTQVKQQVQAAQEKTAEAERREAEARADYRDVLRLVDIMSASPAGIKAVLEAYLKRLGAYCYRDWGVELLFIISICCYHRGGH